MLQAINKNTAILVAIVSVLWGSISSVAHAGSFLINEVAGFNDTTTASAVGGNLGTTVGEQRSYLLSEVASYWTTILQPAVDITISVEFTSLSCTANSAVLGTAAPAASVQSFSGATFTGTWYPAALYQHITGFTTSNPAVEASFNSNIDGSPDCFQSNKWYYGYDHSPGVNEIDLYAVILHEMSHGLGFLTYVNKSTGRRALSLEGPEGEQVIVERDDVFMKFLRDDSTNTAWADMTDAERAASVIDNGDLVWAGSEVQNLTTVLNDGLTNGYVRMYAPTTMSVGSSVEHFDTNVTYVDNAHELLEPFEESPFDIAMTVALLRDIGWDLASYDYDEDGTNDSADAFPDKESGDTDTDNDGMPDELLPPCSSSPCGGLTLDGDDDGDGVQDVVDAAPLDSGNSSENNLPLDGSYEGSLNQSKHSSN